VDHVGVITWGDIAVFLTVWIIFGWMSQAIGKRKLRPILASGLAGALFGPLALLVALMVRPRFPMHGFCPHCHYAVPLGAWVCGHCGLPMRRRH
jgi:hypothetical protein